MVMNTLILLVIGLRPIADDTTLDQPDTDNPVTILDNQVIVAVTVDIAKHYVRNTGLSCGTAEQQPLF